jgi:hypothetical protein
MILDYLKVKMIPFELGMNYFIKLVYHLDFEDFDMNYFCKYWSLVNRFGWDAI